MERVQGQHELNRRSCLEKQRNNQGGAKHALILQKSMSWKLSLNPESREADALTTEPGFG
jgi:hypothetical protein